MTGTKTVPPEFLEQAKRDRERIAAELPQLTERHARMTEAKAENTFCGHLRRAIHHSGRLIRDIAAEVGIDSKQLLDFLEGTRTLRSDLLDRLAQAVGAKISVEPTLPPQAETARADPSPPQP